jgi:hypothetical protein
MRLEGAFRSTADITGLSFRAERGISTTTHGQAVRFLVVALLGTTVSVFRQIFLMRSHAGGLAGSFGLHTRCHAAAFCCATAACRCALLAMSHLILCAFFAAGIAHVGADIAKCRGEFTSARHIAGRHAADLRTVHIKRDAARHRLYVLLGQAGGCAVIAGSSARITLVDAGLKLFMSHDDLL